MKRPKYAEGVAWIAENDEPLDRDGESIRGYISVLLLATLFGRDPLRVAGDVLAQRLRADKEAS